MTNEQEQRSNIKRRYIIYSLLGLVVVITLAVISDSLSTAEQQALEIYAEHTEQNSQIESSINSRILDIANRTADVAYLENNSSYEGFCELYDEAFIGDYLADNGITCTDAKESYRMFYQSESGYYVCTTHAKQLVQTDEQPQADILDCR